MKPPADQNLHWGVQLHPQYTDWPTLKRLAHLVEDLGYDSLWTWDHLMAHVPVRESTSVAGAAVVGQPDGSNLESWQLLAAWAAITKRVRIGSLATSNTHRHPALVAKMVSTLDHISSGRAILGMGAGGLVDEQRAYGLSQDSVGTRISRLAEAMDLMTSLLEGKPVTFEGRYYQITGVTLSPLPLQAHLPVLIAGGGERTRRIASRFADMWSCPGSPEVLAPKIAALQSDCQEAGRDPNSLVVLAGGEGLPGFVKVVVRNNEAAVDVRLRQVATHNRMDFVPARTTTMGDPEQVAMRLLDYCKAGAGGFIVAVAPPDDEETLERLAAEVRPRLEALRRSSV